jgi:sarcosine oxidase
VPAAIDRYDLAVVGLGLIGSAALRHVATRGHRAIGIGPAEPPAFARHEGAFASHYDSGRITRHVDPHLEWAELARRTIAEYPTIEAEGEPFHRPVGLIYAVTEADQVGTLRRVMAELGHGVACREVDGSPDPRVRLADRATSFVEDGPAGHIDPRRLVRAQLTAAGRRGARIVRAEVRSLERSGDGWQVVLRDGRTVHAGRVVVAGGPHADEIDGVAMPTIDVIAETVLTGVVDTDEQVRLHGLPSIITPVEHRMYDSCYFVPPTPYPDGSIRLKIGAGTVVERHLRTAAERRAWMRGDDHQAELEPLSEVLHELLPGLRTTAECTTPCLIAYNASGFPVIDHVADGVVAVAGCNGYAAKSSDAIGALAVSLAVDGVWRDRLSHEPFRLR